MVQNQFAQSNLSIAQKMALQDQPKKFVASTDRNYPAWRYHRDGREQVVKSADFEPSQFEEGWRNSPWPVEPVPEPVPPHGGKPCADFDAEVEEMKASFDRNWNKALSESEELRERLTAAEALVESLKAQLEEAGAKRKKG